MITKEKGSKKKNATKALTRVFLINKRCIMPETNQLFSVEEKLNWRSEWILILVTRSHATEIVFLDDHFNYSDFFIVIKLKLVI